MQTPARWALTAAMVLGLGVLGAEPYARLTAPAYQAAAVAIGSLRDWTITRVAVEPDEARPGRYLRLHGLVSGDANSHRGASVILRVQVGAVIEGPLIFWSLVAAWPGTRRQRLVRAAIGLPLFLGLEIATTVCQLLSACAEAAAALDGDPDGVSPWDQWSRFLESGGRDVLAVCVALLTVTLASRLAPADAAPPRS